MGRFTWPGWGQRDRKQGLQPGHVTLPIDLYSSEGGSLGTKRGSLAQHRLGTDVHGAPFCHCQPRHLTWC